MNQEPEAFRLNKFIALHKGLSRRQSDDLIADGKVTVNDTVAILGARIRPGDKVMINGTLIDDTTKYQYIMFNKPVGYVCSRSAQGDSPTIYEILPGQYRLLKTVGRLDRDSSGLILLTNDGDFAQQMTHPSFNKQKRYIVTLDRDLEPLHQQMISDIGVDLDDGKSQLTLERQSDDNRKEWIISMHEGRNRQIRRTFGALGYTVVALHRTDFGSYTLGDLEFGKVAVTDKK